MIHSSRDREKWKSMIARKLYGTAPEEEDHKKDGRRKLLENLHLELKVSQFHGDVRVRFLRTSPNTSML